jgi:hypothetical protein
MKQLLLGVTAGVVAGLYASGIITLPSVTTSPVTEPEKKDTSGETGMDFSHPVPVEDSSETVDVSNNGV